MSAAESSTGGEGRGPLFLLDGSNIAYRAFFALPEGIATSAGFPTNALYGFCAMVIKILADYRPSAVIVAWDSREKTFRHQEFEEYKAQRKPMPDLLSEQWPYFTELSEAFGFVNLAVPGWEADDILATLARQAESQGRETFIVTGDRDALQLAGENVRIMSNTRGVTEVKIYDPAAVEERFGVPPRLIPDLIGLKGDTSDNIPGVPGIGEKTAALAAAAVRRPRRGAGQHRQGERRQAQGAADRASRRSRCSRRGWPRSSTTRPSTSRPPRCCRTSVQRDKLEELFTRFEFSSLMDRVEPLLVGARLRRGRRPARARRSLPASCRHRRRGARRAARLVGHHRLGRRGGSGRLRPDPERQAEQDPPLPGQAPPVRSACGSPRRGGRPPAGATGGRVAARRLRLVHARPRRGGGCRGRPAARPARRGQAGVSRLQVGPGAARA